MQDTTAKIKSVSKWIGVVETWKGGTDYEIFDTEKEVDEYLEENDYNIDLVEYNFNVPNDDEYHIFIAGDDECYGNFPHQT